MCRDYHDSRPGAFLEKWLNEVQAVLGAEANVEEDQIEGGAGRVLHGGFDGGGFDNFMAIGFQAGTYGETNICLIVDDEDSKSRRLVWHLRLMNLERGIAWNTSAGQVKANLIPRAKVGNL